MKFLAFAILVYLLNIVFLVRGTDTDPEGCHDHDGYFPCYQHNAAVKCNRRCHYKMSHCQCDLNYKMVKGDCELCSTFECPSNSTRRRKNCIKDLCDCKCDYGFKPNKKTKTCDNCRSFICPDNSKPKDKECIKDFGDCDCKHGYKKNNGNCIACNTYTCPENSETKSSVECLKRKEQCKCVQGFKEDEKGDCTISCNSFTCPVNSQPKKKEKCIKDFGCCECLSGFIKKDGQCVECPYTCPEHSCLKDPSKCPNKFSDCVCMHGFKKEKYSKKCIKCGYCDTWNNYLPDPLEFNQKRCWHPECPNPEYNPIIKSWDIYG